MSTGSRHNFNPTAGIHVQVGLVAFTLILGSFSCHANRPNVESNAIKQVSRIPANLPPLSQPDPIGMKELDLVRPIYKAVIEQSGALFQNGSITEATQRLLDVVPESQRTAVHNLHMGNLLFGPNPDQSFLLHLE